MIERLELEKFTAFEKLDMKFSPGVNIIIGQNGIGKTHVLKILYSALEFHAKDRNFEEQLINVFLPLGKQLGRLVKQPSVSTSSTVKITFDSHLVMLKFSSGKQIVAQKNNTNNKQPEKNGDSIFIPVKEFLSHAPGFMSLYTLREIHFDETYFDLLTKAYSPPLRDISSSNLKHIVHQLEKSIEGKVVIKGETFFLKNKSGEIEFDLLAEGTSKLGLLWLLIKNGTLDGNATLFWDEPEANINPSKLEILVPILLELQRIGVQIFITTHNYLLLKWFDLKKKNSDNVKFFSFTREEQGGEITTISGETYLDIMPNKISEAYESVYDEQIKISLGGR